MDKRQMESVLVKALWHLLEPNEGVVVDEGENGKYIIAREEENKNINVITIDEDDEEVLRNEEDGQTFNVE